MFKSNMRTMLAMLHDAVAAALAWSLAYLLRFNFELPPSFVTELQQTLFWVVPLQLIIFWQFSLYRGIWRYASTTDLRRIFLAVMLSATAIPLVFWMLRLGKQKMDFGDQHGFNFDRLHLNVAELERIGPTLVLDYRPTSGGRVLIWTQ